MKTHRLARVSEVIREVAAETILFEIRDPRVKNTTVTRVETAGDLQHAKVYVSIMGTEAQQQRGVIALQNAAGFVQSKLAKRMTTRFLPTLTFILDEGIKKSIEVARLLYEEKVRNGEIPADQPFETVDEVDADSEDDLDEDDDTEESAEPAKPV
jgi:ribosome-binding factor A